jgi:mycothiol synthase
MLSVRSFMVGEDEEVWLRIQNEAYREYEDVRSDTMEDMEIWKKSPNFDSAGMFIAELDGKPVGVVNGFVDKFREEKMGFLRVLGVVPEFRRRGVGRCLVEKAVESLKERGMKSIQGWTREGRASCKSLLEGMGFTLTRVYNAMRVDLKKIPYNVGEHEKLVVREMEMRKDDMELVRWLNNEAFKEHFNFRPHTSEEYKFWLTNKPWGCNILGVFIAHLDEKPVGYVEAGIDSKFIEDKGIKRGWILSVGVLKPNRTKGIGTALMQHAMKFLKSEGMNDVELGVDDSNPTKAIELYKKMGFKIVYKELTYTKKIN